jgi:hypothetical protein
MIKLSKFDFDNLFSILEFWENAMFSILAMLRQKKEARFKEILI